MRNPYLRVKLKSLAEEARIIHVEERRALRCRDYDLQASLRFHRITTVRFTARATLLAYQYLRGIPYLAIEKKGSSTPNLKSITSMVNRYGPKNIETEDIQCWIEGEAIKIAA